MRSSIFILLVLTLLSIQNASAQDETVAQDIAWEQLTEQQEQEQELDELAATVAYFTRHPIPVSALQSAQLVLFGLHPLQIKAFELYVKQFGPITEKYELQAIPYWNIEIIKRLLPLLNFSSDGILQIGKTAWWKAGDHQLLIRTGKVLEKAKGYLKDSSGKSTYAGSPERLFLRYSYQLNQSVWGGFTLEKDGGETLGKNGKLITDFSGFHFSIKGKKLIRQLAIGDYTINAGQGLVVWQGLSFGKGAEGAGIFRQAVIMKPYRSAGEANFFRGTAIQLAKGNWELVSWFSNRKKSGTIQQDSTGPVSFSSLSTSGYHRTQSEINGRKQIGEQVAGTVLRWQKKWLRLSWNGLFHQFSIPWLPRQEIYNKFVFRGASSFHQSIDYTYGHKQLFLFGEVARGGGGWAQVHGLLAVLSNKVDWSMLYRHIQRNYHAYFASAFTEQAAVRNEEGFYSSVQVKFNSAWKLQVYADFFRFPWLRFRTDAPSSGREARVLLQWEKRRKWVLYGYFRLQSKPLNQPAVATHEIVPVLQENLRFHMERMWGRSFNLSSRFDLCWFHQGIEKQRGWGWYADGRYQFPKNGWQLTGRLHWFSTDGYDTRLYSYERDLLYSYSVPALYDKGFRYYFQWQGRLKMRKSTAVSVKWWLRWSRSQFNNKTSIGSGWDEIEDNTRSEWKFQVLVGW